MGGRGQSMSVSGIPRGGDTGEIGKIRNYVKNGAVGEYLSLKMDSVVKYPQLQGSHYDMLNKVSTADFNKRIGGVFSHNDKEILINNSVDKSRRQAVIAHELGHAYTAGQRYDSAEKAVNNAFNEYKKKNPNATVSSMSRNISDYAITKPREAFAEAFSDVATKGKNANPVSISIIDHWNKLFEN